MEVCGWFWAKVVFFLFEKRVGNINFAFAGERQKENDVEGIEPSSACHDEVGGHGGPF